MTAGEGHLAGEAPQSTGKDAPPAGSRSGGLLGRLPAIESLGQRFGLLLAWGIVVLVFSILRPSEFATTTNFETIFSSQAALVILAIASIPPLIAGELDLSFAGVFGMGIVMLGLLNVNDGWPIVPSIIVTLLIGAAIGLANALVVVVFGVDSIVATLGMGTLLGGVALGLNPIPISGISNGLINLVDKKYFGLEVAFYMAVACCLILWFVFVHTPTGRRLYFVGAGRPVARLSGIRVDWLRAGAFVLTALLSAAAGVIFAGQVGASDSTIGPTFFTPTLAAVFLGATAITPGRFNVWGTFIGVYFLVSGITGLELIGLSGWIVQVFYGGALIVAVVVSRLIGMRVHGLRSTR